MEYAIERQWLPAPQTLEEWREEKRAESRFGRFEDAQTAARSLPSFRGVPQDVDLAWESNQGRLARLDLGSTPALDPVRPGRDMGYRPVRIDEGFRAGGDTLPQDQPTEVYQEVDTHATILHREASPLRQPAGAGVPAAVALYQEGEEGVHLKYVVGTPAAPEVRVAPVAEPLFIHGAPHVEDVQQGFLVGDCWLMAALAEITARDPGAILDCLRPAGPAVEVTLYSSDDQGVTWDPRVFQVGRDVLQRTGAGSSRGSALLSAQVRVAPSPAGAAWFCDLEGEALTVVRQDEYELALWVALLEKAYARFAESYGEDGLGVEGSRQSGYTVIDGGWDDEAFCVIGGPAVRPRAQRRVDTDEPGADGSAVLANPRAIRLLVRASASGDDGGVLLLDVSASAPASARRLHDCIAALRGDPTLSDAELALVGALGPLDALCLAVPDAGVDDEDWSVLLPNISVAARSLVAPGAWPVLADPVFRDLRDQLGVLATAGPAQVFDERTAIADHAYTVLNATFVDTDGAPFVPSLDHLDQDLLRIDGERSMVTLRNPHGCNEPNLDAADSDPKDGVFELSLERYLRIFTVQCVAGLA